jgi:hypothetical protein
MKRGVACAGAGELRSILFEKSLSGRVEGRTNRSDRARPRLYPGEVRPNCLTLNAMGIPISNMWISSP